MKSADLKPKLRYDMAAIITGTPERRAKAERDMLRAEVERLQQERVEFVGIVAENERLRGEIEQLKAARDEACDIAEYLHTYVPKFPAVGGPTQSERRVAELRKVGGK